MIMCAACRNSRAAAAVEFGLTAPLFMLLIFGIIESGLMLWTQQGLQHGVELAARCAIVDKSICPDASSTQNYAMQQIKNTGVNADQVTVTAQPCGSQVSATYTYRFITTYFGTPSLTLTAQSCVPQ